MYHVEEKRHVRERPGPLASVQEPLKPQWGVVQGVRTAVSYRGLAEEQDLARKLGLCDASAFRTIGVRFTSDQALEDEALLPREILDWTLRNGVFIGRTGQRECFVECRETGPAVERIVAGLEQHSGTLTYAREDACILLTGAGREEVMSQVCAVDLYEAPSRLIFTQCAGVVAMLLPDTLGDVPLYRLWLDPTYAPYLWQALLSIVRELGGDAVGLAGLYSVGSAVPHSNLFEGEGDGENRVT